jgi:hypothetical protein
VHQLGRLQMQPSFHPQNPEALDKDRVSLGEFEVSFSALFDPASLSTLWRGDYVVDCISNEDQDVTGVRSWDGVNSIPTVRGCGPAEASRRGFFSISDRAATERATQGKPGAYAGAKRARSGVRNDPSPVRICSLGSSAQSAIGPH